MSRLYIGEWNLNSLEQDFSYKCKKGSIGLILKKEYFDNINVFTGTSYGATHLARILKVKEQRQTLHKSL